MPEEVVEEGRDKSSFVSQRHTGATSTEATRTNGRSNFEKCSEEGNSRDTQGGRR